MTRIFVPVFAVALLTIGTLNAQTHGKPAPAKKKVTVPVNRVPVPVARPVVPVAKPAPSIVKPAAPVVAKPAAPAPKPVAAPAPKPVVAPKPVPKPVAVKPAAPAKKAPAAITKSPVKKKAVIVRKAKASPAPEEMAAPAPRKAITRYEENAAPASKKIVEERIVIRDDSNDEMESESGNKPKGHCEDQHAATNGPLSIDGCHCYSHGPHGCKPWKFRNRRYYRYQYTMQHYRGCSGSGCNGGCKK